MGILSYCLYTCILYYLFKHDTTLLSSLLNFTVFSVDDEDNRGDGDDTKIESDNKLDSFDEVYRTYELTDFDKLLSRSIARTEYVTNTVQ